MKTTLLFLFLLFSGKAYCGLPSLVYTGTVNKTVAQAVKSKTISAGTAANDPAIATTMVKLSTTLQNSIAANDALLTGPLSLAGNKSWLGWAFAAGVIGGYSLVDMATENWQYDAASYKVKRTPQAGILGEPTLTAPSSPYDDYLFPPISDLPQDYSGASPGQQLRYPTDKAVCVLFSSSGSATFSPITACASDMPAIELAIDRYTNYQHHFWVAERNAASATFDYIKGTTTNTAYQKQSCAISVLNCPDGVLYQKSRTVEIKYKRPEETSYTSLTTTVTIKVISNPYYVVPGAPLSFEESASQIDVAALQSRADADLIARMANRLWQDASLAPGFDGVPYNPLNPITAADVLADKAANPHLYPNNRNLFEPLSQPGQSPALDPEAAITPVESQSTGTEPSPTVTLDIPPSPVVPEPSLDGAPTGSQIFEPILDLLPDFKNFRIGNGGYFCNEQPARCQCQSIDLMTWNSTTYTMTSHCTIAAQHEATFQVLMQLVFSLGAAMMILRA